MRCPYCEAPSRVLETNAHAAYTTRRRQCTGGHRFTTQEAFVPGTVTDGPATRALSPTLREREIELLEQFVESRKSAGRRRAKQHAQS